MIARSGSDHPIRAATGRRRSDGAGRCVHRFSRCAGTQMIFTASRSEIGDGCESVRPVL